MKDILIVGAGGFAGSVLRYAISLLMPLSVGSIPWGTLTVNFTGSLIIGLLFSAELPYWWALLLITGFCGGFTTFSTFSLEVVNAFRGGHTMIAAIYILISFALCIIAVVAGIYLGMRLR